MSANFCSSEDNIIKILNAFERFEDITIPKTTNKYDRYFSKIVNKDDIIKNDYNFNIKRYADASPPEEMFNLEGIINSGIPIEEIEDEYIQEIIQDVDLELIIEKKDNKFFKFKEKILNRSQIPKLLENYDKRVINIFEQWWDKYNFSIKYIQNELMESEKNLNEILEEIKIKSDEK